MTALNKYARLEGPGLWRTTHDSQRRDVVVALGKASLTLSDSRSGEVLAHWSLPAVVRLNRGSWPALYAPDADTGADGETLELDDETLVEALETIRRALNPPARARRLRRAVAAAVLALALLAGWLWFPPMLSNHAASIVPQAGRAQIGRAALDALPAAMPQARVCTNPAGRQALTTLRARILGSGYRASAIAGVPGFEAAHLPGRMILVGETLLLRLDSPEALAGYLLAEAQALEAEDPLRDVLRFAGTRATMTLLTTGHLPDNALDGYVAGRIALPPASPDPEALGTQLGALGLSPAPYAISLPASAAPLAEALADLPRPGLDEPAGRLLSDGEWLTLQGICDN
ncbi:MAG: hypothetical protein JJT95_16735 [Pararhodobacter sp.]|nr:hypothetical protein [Pararhodobacter sp.]